MYNDEQIKIITMIQVMAKGYGVKMLADHLSMAPQTLYSDMDPKSIGRRTNKLGFLDWLVILSETKDLSSLDATNLLFKRISLPLPEPDKEMTTADWMVQCATTVKEAGEAVAVLAESMLDGRMEDEEMERCEKEGTEAMIAFAGLIQEIKKRRAQQ